MMTRKREEEGWEWQFRKTRHGLVALPRLYKYTNQHLYTLSEKAGMALLGGICNFQNLGASSETLGKRALMSWLLQRQTLCGPSPF